MIESLFLTIAVVTESSSSADAHFLSTTKTTVVKNENEST